MERAPLRPVPDRPSGPVSDATAIARVSAALPELGEREHVALALAAVAGRSRGQIALRLGVDEREVAEVLARARKQLRRTLAQLSGSGWCERAERLISDRIDGALAAGDEPRLDVHLRNCPRCVEHERRLVQATDALVEGAAPAPSGPALAPPSAAAPAAPTPESAAPAPESAAPAPESAAPAPESAAPAPESAVSAPAASVAAAPVSASGSAASSGDAAESPTERRSALEWAAAVGWNVLIAVAVILALAALALALAGALGAQI
jgi:hypothetical protein